MLLKPVPVSNATMMAWALACRDTALLYVVYHVWGRWLVMDSNKGHHAQEKIAGSVERKTVITPLEERPG
jgi:hypothetical protein